LWADDYGERREREVAAITLSEFGWRERLPGNIFL
jgi:hypothetical protein